VTRDSHRHLPIDGELSGITARIQAIASWQDTRHRDGHKYDKTSG
jgi:hypothetical protein